MVGKEMSASFTDGGGGLKVEVGILWLWWKRTGQGVFVRLKPLNLGSASVPDMKE